MCLYIYSLNVVAFLIELLIVSNSFFASLYLFVNLYILFSNSLSSFDITDNLNLTNRISIIFFKILSNFGNSYPRRLSRSINLSAKRKPICSSLEYFDNILFFSFSNISPKYTPRGCSFMKSEEYSSNLFV